MNSNQTQLLPVFNSIIKRPPVTVSNKLTDIFLLPPRNSDFLVYKYDVLSKNFHETSCYAIVNRIVTEPNPYFSRGDLLLALQEYLSRDARVDECVLPYVIEYVEDVCNLDPIGLVRDELSSTEISEILSEECRSKRSD